MPTLYGTFYGTHEALWSMEIEDGDWNEYMAKHPNFDSTDVEQMEDMWEYFKGELNYYDAPEESVDLENNLTQIEAYIDGKDIFNENV